MRPCTQIRLMVGGKTVRETSGRNSEQLATDFWNVHEFAGRPAHIEIVDEEKGGWGHILVDQIEFSDRADAGRWVRCLEGIVAGPIPRRAQASGPNPTDRTS